MTLYHLTSRLVLLALALGLFVESIMPHIAASAETLASLSDILSR